MSIETADGPVTRRSDGAGRAAAARLLARASECLSREAAARRPFLWLPVAMGLGIVLYFAAEAEPSTHAPAVLAALSLLAAVAARNRPVACGGLAGLAAAFAGFALAGWRAADVAAPVLERPAVGLLSGFVETTEARSGGGRLLLRVHGFADRPPERLPFRVRVTLPQLGTVKAGDFIIARARLVPPPPASRPGGYDFAREAYFQRIGAVGSIMGAVELAPPPVEAPPSLRAAAAVDRARNALTARIVAVIGGAPGAVAASLVTGKRGLIPEPVNEALRAAGIYHVVSISGLHMVLAAGMVFWFVRAAAAAIPALALRWPVRKVAALVAILAGCGYNVFAGAEIATQRALVMSVALFGAVLADRAALSMRNLAFAALIVMALEPESVLGPSFQMSFAAVAALIALYERTGSVVAAGESGIMPAAGGGGPPAEKAPAGAGRRAAAWMAKAVVGTAAATLAAEAATSPFGLYHFQRYTLYGLIGNALTLPLVSVVVMPMAVLGALATPFGLDAPFWRMMGWGVAAMLRLSDLVASWPGARGLVPAFGTPALLLLVLAGLWLVLMTTALRWLAILPALAGVALAATAQAPSIVIAPDGRSAMVRQADGRLTLVGASPGAFVLDQWLRADADLRAADDPTVRQGPRCDPAGCVARLADGRALAIVLKPAAFEEDCRRAVVLVSPLSAPAWCRPAFLFDQPLLARTGALALRNDGGGFRVTASRSALTTRPWHPVPPQVVRAPAETGAEDDAP
jgi:competence protein ComEC